MMYSTIVLILLSVFTSSASAQSITANAKWSEPTARENGQALTPDEISGYRIYRGSPDNPVMLEEVTGTQHVLTIDAGECYMLTVTAVDTMGLESQHSNSINVCASSPIAPSDFLIKIQ